ncbi:transcriptional regulator, GntR family [Ferrimonas balearica DSM 9799]|uniref:Pyruvate dehydrogenase complex repressor n=1 Tax=Ferrimonas balearica (strain DSM 9799 / CCM 4581 / KCTC 23876 / PAT) TaxID=550540 RepID=E1SN84_FERBD|nr:pyruvate dehydrogenase complex transcriptional repressor PdhR [Ferrimonas balearica]MBY6018564.1 pyruvate dehydrogenase complex transcriptional repressor PdhR [Halomonas denitrificans]MBY6187775.1 pyruvate dehydrogenase complex transcriptional repressor PdhR [Marinobacter nauticus]ADN74583.1 transcriptional regulator, GntR family [Ferrimonas balearica DSM 9799]MBW3140396.1 pyruvate dehydrogenase complex transcriptional repressor PdhR [Ferrimonas balearica]MBW3165612.1 pyruvate dehydrogenase
MTYRRINQPKLSDVILKELEKMILEGSLKPGQKLPPERELAVQFEVSRPSLREAIQKLEAKGVLTRRQGGGTYVKQQLWNSLADPLVELLASNPESQYDLLEFRYATEGMMAYYAAARGTDADHAQMRQKMDTIKSVQGDTEAEAQAIVDFYRSIAEASHNVAMLHLVLSLTPLLVRNVAENLELLYRRERSSEVANTHREALLEAILKRDPELARRASNDHLAYIEEVTLEVRQEDSRQQRSLRRMRNDL